MKILILLMPSEETLQMLDEAVSISSSFQYNIIFFRMEWLEYPNEN